WLEDGRGTTYVPARPQTLALLERLASEFGLSFTGVASRPSSDAYQLRPVRIGLSDRWGGSMPSGWVRWLFEQHEFDYKLVFPQELDAGNLASKFDVLVFAAGSIPARDGGPDRGGGGAGGSFGGPPPRPEEVESEFRSWLGNITVAKTVPKLKEFLEAGGA